MAYHFSANQYEDKYSPRKLGNWEHPKWYPERPRQRFKPTKIIADDSGRLLDGIKRENPWGNYVGTWDLPRRITREYVKKLVEPPERLVNLWAKQKKTPSELYSQGKSAEEDKSECFPVLDQNANSIAQKSFERRNKSCSALDLRPRPTKLEPLTSLQEKKDNLHNIKPGSLDEKIQQIIESVEEKQKSSDLALSEHCKEIKALPRRSKQKTEPKCQVEKPKSNDEYKFLDSLENHVNKFESVAEDVEEEKDEKLDLSQFEKPESSPKMRDEKPKPLKNGYSPNFQIAKRYHDENLRHKPLPDVIDDPVFKALTSSRHPNPAEALTVQPIPSAIGWKPYSAPGPTECSKLKVYRPKTAVDKVKPQKEIRPKTGGSGTLKKRFLPIDLAICWDLKPDDPSDEPKRSPHIDGSNGSAAPAVFTMIKPTETVEEDQNIAGSCQAVAERITKGIDEDNAVTLPSQLNGKARTPMSMTSNREAIMSCIKSPEGHQKAKTDTPDTINSISTNAAEYARKNPKTAWTNEDTSKILSDRLLSLQNEKRLSNSKFSPVKCGESYRNKNHHQSTPNLTNVCEGSHCGTEKSSPGSSKLGSKPRSCGSANAAGMESRNESFKPSKNGQKKNRNCSACDKNNSDSQDSREKSEFKSAFKAGVPNSESSHSGTSSGTKSYKVPKMRLPYAKRSYSIGTLAPPFSLWREKNGQEYPEHWRLASVYQHSYKPINSRKRPLLASVYQ